MKLLINKVLKEKFNTYQVEATILVYLIPGRMFETFKRGEIRITLTDCLEKETEQEYKKFKKKEQKDLKKKYKEGHLNGNANGVGPDGLVSIEGETE